jgi:SET domain-containing protein
MTTPIPFPSLCIEDTGTPKGKGVFARKKFRKGEVVETAPVLVLKVEHDTLPELLKSYVFDWATLAGVPRAQGLALGYGSMYNHANPANLRYVADGRESLMRYVAVRTIQIGEELTINYNAKGGVHESDDDNWFERMGIEPLRDGPA